MSTMVKTIKNGSATVQTFVFQDPEQEMSTGIRSKIWQILPASVATLTCLPFGIMLGWPSPTYPKLLPEDSSPIPITIDQSAMIAGFLMIGNILGTPFSFWSFLGTKFGIIFGSLLMTIGWIVMWYASSIYYLLGSRLLIGFGCGYGAGQLKIYIKDMCQPNHAVVLSKLISFYIFFGVVIAYILGCFVSFTDFSLVAMIVTAVVCFLCFWLPHTPKEYLRYGKIKEAARVVRHIKPNCNIETEVNQMTIELERNEKDMSFSQVYKNKTLAKHLAIVCLLVFFQQFSGAPATIIYTQIIFTASHCPFPEYCAISYVVVFVLSNFAGTFYFNKYNHKTSLLVSSFSVSSALILNIAVYYFKFNEDYWKFTSLITMFFFIFLHSIGLAVVPFALTQEYFPVRARKVVSQIQIMLHSAFALLITKIFQVLYARYDLYIPFCLFLAVSMTCSVFVLFFVPYNSPVLNEDVKISKVQAA